MHMVKIEYYGEIQPLEKTNIHYPGASQLTG